MTEQTLSAKVGHSLYIFTPLGLIRIEMTSARKLKFFLPESMQAFRPDKLERMRQELTLVGTRSTDQGKSGLVPAFRFLVPMLDKDGFLVGVASADDATFVLSEELTLPMPETEEGGIAGVHHFPVDGEEQLKEETENVPAQA